MASLRPFDHEVLIYQAHINEKLMYNDLLKQYLGVEEYEDAVQASIRRERLERDKIIAGLDKYFRAENCDGTFEN